MVSFSIETGFGFEDARNPRQLGVAFSAMMRPRPEISTTAVKQIEALGFTASDVRHIVATHLDLDHAAASRTSPTPKCTSLPMSWRRLCTQPTGSAPLHRRSPLVTQSAMGDPRSGRRRVV